MKYPLKFENLTTCQGCSEKNLSLIHDFGLSPLAGYFPFPNEKKIPLLPLQLFKCEKCKLIQVSPNIDDSFLFKDYRYVSSISMQNHFDEFARWFKNQLKAPIDSRILEIGSKHRTTGETNMNEASSRSHAVFTLTIEQCQWQDGIESVGARKRSKIHFIDLAGNSL